jgi:hypothetical protein
MREAAKFYLQYIGQKGTEKQIDKIIKQVGVLVVKLATDRGFKGGQ